MAYGCLLIHNLCVKVSEAEFNKKCQILLDKVVKTGETIQITKDGQIVAELSRRYSGPGLAKGEMEIVGDIMEPIDVEWEALR